MFPLSQQGQIYFEQIDLLIGFLGFVNLRLKLPETGWPTMEFPFCFELELHIFALLVEFLFHPGILHPEHAAELLQNCSLLSAIRFRTRTNRRTAINGCR